MWIVGGVLLAAVLAVCVYGFVLKAGDTVYPNVYVADVNVGGLNRAAAIAAVEDSISESFTSDTLRVVLPDRELSLDPEVTNVALNADEAIDAAMRYGRDKGPISAILAYRNAQNTEHTIDLESSLNLDTEYIRSIIDKAAAEAECRRTDPVVSVDEDKKQILVQTGSPEVHLDAEGLYNAVLDRFKQNDFSDLQYEYNVVPCDPVDLKPYYTKYCTEAADAFYDEEKHELVEEVKGFGFDLEHFTQMIAMAEPGKSIVIPMVDQIPEVTLEQLKKTYFSATLASYDSPHVVNSNRTNNLTLACKEINGTVLNPGEVFSFNDIVGERTAQKGYLGATVYQTGGKSETETGGGVCQVASTIYECCLYANLEVIERAPHMFTVTYVEPGQDATIYWGQLDFKFKNTTGYPLRVDASVSDGYVHIKFVGTEEPKEYDHVKMSYTTGSQKDWKTVGVTDKAGTPFDVTVTDNTATDAEGNTYKVVDTLETAYTGKTVVTYRHFMDKDDKELSKEQVARSVYEKRDKKLLLELVKPAEEEPEVPYDPNAEYDENGNYTGDPSALPDDPNAPTQQYPDQIPGLNGLITPGNTNPNQNPFAPDFW